MCPAVQRFADSVESLGDPSGSFKRFFTTTIYQNLKQTRPYVDMEGLTIFPRESLLNWASPASHIQPVKYEAA